MIKKVFTVLVCLMAAIAANADNWSYIISHPEEFYFGTGTASTWEDANQAALANLMSGIATHVSSDFTKIDDMTTTNGSLEHKEKVLMCVKTYSQATLTNTKFIERKDNNEITVLRYLEVEALAKVFESRAERAKELAARADECLAKGKVDLALQNYYWAHALVRSLQFPNEVKDSRGRMLVNWLPQQIDEVLGDITVRYDNREGEFVDLLFNYRDEPVQCLQFSYNDGRQCCGNGTANDGRGQIEMIQNYQTDVYHVDIEYEYKSESIGGDPEMESVLKVIPKRTFGKAVHRISVKGVAQDGRKPAAQAGGNIQQAKTEPDKTGINLKPQASQLADDHSAQAEILGKVMDAIRNRRYYEADKYFTVEGLDRYHRLVKYGTGRIVGTPRLLFFKGMNGTTICRGMQMAFSFKNGSKGNDGRKTYVEDVVFTFDRDNRIDNLTFGLGQVAENDILCREATLWKDDTREMLMEFLENYKTAYCLKDIKYIEKVFSDDAIIIVGNVIKPKAMTLRKGTYETTIVDAGKEIIRESRYTKQEYIEHLKKCFARSEFINIRFTNTDLELLERFYPKEEIWGMQLGQEYNSSRYGDMGYLFLLVDMTNHDEPQIHVRTWQPNRVPLKERYSSETFFIGEDGIIKK